MSIRIVQIKITKVTRKELDIQKKIQNKGSDVNAYIRYDRRFY